MNIKNTKTFHWNSLFLLSLIILITAIYAMTTWNDKTLVPAHLNRHEQSQLPDQNHMPASLQAQPDSTGSLNAGNANQLQQTTPPPNDSNPSTYPGCRGAELGATNSRMMCEAQ